MSQELTTTNQGMLTPVPLSDVHAQIQAIQALMQSEMKEGLDGHYAKIPGCGDKKVLLKAGAEKMNLLFRLAPTFQITKREIPNHPGHREYEVITTLTQINTGQVWGQGVGLCSTMESKYRYRQTQDLEETGLPVPKGYWDLRRDDPKKAQELLGGPEFVTKKVDNAWMLFKKVGDGQRVENPDIADTHNIVLKMAKKRSHVDAVITVTATSDIFTQDLDEGLPQDQPSSPPPPPPPPSPPNEPTKKNPAKNPPATTPTPPQQNNPPTTAKTPDKERVRQLDLMCAIFAKNAGQSLIEWKKANLRGMSFEEAELIVTRMYDDYFSPKNPTTLIPIPPEQITDGIFKPADVPEGFDNDNH